MNPLKEFILYKWAEYGLTPEQVKHCIKTDAIKDLDSHLQKSAEEGIVPAGLKFFTQTAPVLSFGIPLAAGSLLYMATHPDDMRERERKKRIEYIESAIKRVKES